MNRRIANTVGAAMCGLTGAAALADVSLAGDRGVTYRTDAGPSGGADFGMGLGWVPDFLDQQWWWWRSDAGPGFEQALAAPDSISTPLASRAVMGWSGLGGSPLSATLTVDVGFGQYPYDYGWSVNHTLTVTNNDVLAHAFSAYHFIDFNNTDLDGNTYGATTEGDGPNFYFHDNRVIGRGWLMPTGTVSAFQVAESGILRPMLDDGNPTELNNSGLPFGPGDLTVAYQWSTMLAPGQSIEVGVRYAQSVPSPATLVTLIPGLLVATRRRR